MTQELSRFLGKDAFFPNKTQLQRLLDAHPCKDDIRSYLGKDIRRLFRWPNKHGGELSDIGILRHLIAGNIRIDPFDITRLQSNGYDVSLGKYYYTAFQNEDKNDRNENYPRLANPQRSRIFNPADAVDVTASFSGPLEAITINSLLQTLDHAQATPQPSSFRVFEGLDATDEIIILPPAQMILGHTIEYIGGRNVVDTTISGKSTTGRLGIEVCSDANKGDIGFVGIWTLEIVNKHPTVAVTLVVGQPIATISFFEVEEPVRKYTGRYTTQNEAWQPVNMLPNWRKK